MRTRRRTAFRAVAWFMLFLFGFVTTFLTVETAIPCPALAQSAPAAPRAASPNVSPQTLNLDLGTSARSIPAATAVTTSARTTGPMQFVSGGATRTVSPSDLLTPAEFVALSQILATGRQTLTLNASGTAVGGNFALNAALAQTINALTIPQGVTAAHNFGTAAALNLAANLTNAGTFYAFSSNPAVTGASIAAANISNAGLLTTILPNLSILGVTGAVPRLNLSLTASGNIANAGIISSSGSLSLSAGGSISNATAAIMQASGTIDLCSQSGRFTNGGLIAAATGGINFSTGQLVRNIVIDNSGGTLQALNGSISIRDQLFSGNANTAMNGGNWLSRQLNVYSGSGAAAIDTGDITGIINVSAGKLGLKADAPSLAIGRLCVDGDPIVVNSGNVDIGNLAPVNGAGYVVLAGGNITYTSDTSIDTSSSTGSGGNVVLVAGANNLTLTLNDSAIAVNPNTGSATGGSIAISSSCSTTPAINTQSTAAGGSGGNVTLVAFAGTGTGSGQISVTSTGGQPAILSSGSGSGKNGNVTVIAGGSGASGTGFAVTAGDIVTGTSSNAGTGGNGRVLIATSVPNVTANPVAIDMSTGAILSGSLEGGTPVDSAISVGNITTSGGNVLLSAGSNPTGLGAKAISAGAITTVPAAGTGGYVSLMTGIAGISRVGTSGYNMDISGAIVTGSTGVAGGQVLMSSVDSIANRGITTSGAPILLIAGIAGTAATNGNIAVAGNGVDTSSQIGSAGNVMLISLGGADLQGTGAIGNINNGSNSGFDIIARSVVSGGKGGSVAVSSARGLLTFGNVDTSATGGSTAGDGGSVLMSTGAFPATATDTVTAASIDASTSRPSAYSGQIWIVTANSYSHANLGTTTQNRGAVPQSVPVTAVIAPFAIGSGPTSVNFEGSDLTVSPVQVGSISGFSAGGFTTISDSSGAVDLKISITRSNSSVTDRTSLIPIISTGAFALSNTASIVEVPTSSNGGMPNLAFFAPAGITLGDSSSAISITTRGRGSLAISGIGSTAGGTTIKNSYSGQSLGIGPSSVNGDFALSSTGTITVSEAQTASGAYSLTSSAGSIAIAADITAPKSVALVASGSSAAITSTALINTSTLSLSSATGGLGGESAPIKTTASSVSLVTTGNAFVVDANSAKVSTTGDGMNDLTFTGTSNYGLITVGSGGISANGTVTLLAQPGSDGGIDIQGDIHGFKPPDCFGCITISSSPYLTNTISLAADGRGSIIHSTDWGSLHGSTVTLSAGATGSIGTSAGNIWVYTGTLNLSAPDANNGNAYLTSVEHSPGAGLGSPDPTAFGTVNIGNLLQYTQFGIFKTSKLSSLHVPNLSIIASKTWVASITIDGPVSASSSITLRAQETGCGIAESTGGANALTAPQVVLISNSGIGSSNNPVVTQSSALTASTGHGSIYLSNTGSASVTASCDGSVQIANTGNVTLQNNTVLPLTNSATGTYSVRTVADLQGNGAIFIAGNVGTSSGPVPTINLTSTSAVTQTAAGSGGISQINGGGTLYGNSVNLIDTGTSTAPHAGDLGSSASPILTQTGALNAKTSGNIFLTNKGAVNLTANSVEGSVTVVNIGKVTISDNADLLLNNSAVTSYAVTTTVDDSGNGQIAIGGNIASSASPVSSIFLTSTSANSAMGGIQESGNGGWTLYGTTIHLSDTGTSTAAYAEDIGSSAHPILTQSSGHYATTTGSVWLNNSEQPTPEGSGSADVGASPAVHGGSYVIIAGGDITDTGYLPIDTSSSSGNGGNVILVAGANNVSSLPNGTMTVINGSTGNARGGSIFISSASSTTPTIDTHSSATDGSGGNVTLVAFAGAVPGSGQIHVAGTGGQPAIRTNGNGTGLNGNVTIIAGGAGDQNSGFAIVLGDIFTGSAANSGSGGNGNITIETSRPNVLANPVIVSGSSSNHSGTGAILAGSFEGGAPVDSAVSVGNLSTSGGNVVVMAGSNSASVLSNAISTGSISTTPAVGAGGNVALLSGVAGASTIGTNGYNIATGTIITGGDSSRAGGRVLMCAVDSIASTGISTSGAPVLMVAGTSFTNGNLSISGPGIDTSTSSMDGGNVLLVSLGGSDVQGTGRVGNIDDGNGSGFNITTASGADGCSGGSVAVSSARGILTFANIDTSAGFALTGGNGGDVLLTTGNSPETQTNTVVATSINTSTSNVGSHAGQIWVITPSSTSAVNLGTSMQMQGTEPEANPVVAVAAPTSIGPGTTQVIFTPSNIAASQNGSIMGYSAGGFTAISDGAGAIDLQVSIKNASSQVQDATAIIPIVSTGMFSVTNNGSSVEVPVSSNGGIPQLAFFAQDDLRIGCSMSTNSQGPLPIAGMGATSGSISITNTASGQNISAAEAVVTGPYTLATTAGISVSGFQIAGGPYTLTTTGTSIDFGASVFAPQSVRLTASGNGAAITQTTGLLSTSDLTILSGAGGIGTAANPVTTDSSQIVLAGTGSSFVTGLRSAQVSTNDQGVGSLTFLEKSLFGQVTIGPTAAGDSLIIQAQVGSQASINIKSDVQGLPITCTLCGIWPSTPRVNTIVLTADGTGSITGPGTLNGSIVTLNAGAAGYIGASGQDVSVIADTLNLSAPDSANGKVFLSLPYSLGAASTALGTTAIGNSLQITSCCGFLTSRLGSLTVPNLTLRVTAPAPPLLCLGIGIYVDSSVSVSSTLTFEAGNFDGSTGSGTISGQTGAVLSAPVVTLKANFGIGASGSYVFTQAGALTAINTGGRGIYLNNNGAVTLTARTGSGSVTIANNGSVTIVDNGASNGAETAYAVSTTSSGSIDVQGNITVGPCTTGCTPVLIIGGGIIQPPPVSITLTADAAGSIMSSTGTGELNASSITLSAGSTGSIGTSTRSISVTADTLSLSAPDSTSGKAFVSSTNNTVTLGTVALGKSLQLSVNGSYSLSKLGALSVPSLTLLTQGEAGNITVDASLSAGAGITLIAAGSGSIQQSAAGGYVLSAPSLVLTSASGNIGTLDNPVKTQAANASVATSRSVWLNNTGALTLLPSSAGGSFTLTNSTSLTVNSLSSNNGSILLKTTGGRLSVADGSELRATGGSLSLQNTNIATGSISIGRGVVIVDSIPAQESGIINVFLGSAPTLTNPTPPSNVVAIAAGSAKIFFGQKGITANSPTSYVNAKGKNAQVVFDTGGAPASSISLAGGDMLVVNSNAPRIASLDLTDPSVSLSIKDAQTAGTVGGLLILNKFNQPIGGTLVLTPIDISDSLSGLNIPANVTVTLINFTSSFLVNVDITSTSHADQVSLNGSLQFTGAATSNAIINVSSDQNPIAISLAKTGTITAVGSLMINANGAMAITGSVNGSVTLQTTNASNGGIAATGTFTSLNGPIRLVSAGDLSTTGGINQYTRPGGALSLSAAGTLTSSSTINAYSGPVQFTSGGALTCSGNIYSSGTILQLSGSSITTSGSINAYAGNIAMTATAGTINISGGAVNATAAGNDGNLQLTANGNITVAGAVTASNRFILETTGSSNGSIALNSTVYANRGLTVTTAGNGTFSIPANKYVTAYYGPVSITAGGVSISGLINAGSNTLTINTNSPAQLISIGSSTAGAFNMPAPTLRQIIAGTIAIGSMTQTGGISVTAPVSLAAGNLMFMTAGNYSAAGQTLSTGTKALTVTALGTVDTGTVSGASAINVTAGTGMNVSGNMVAPNGTISLATTDNGDISWSATGFGGTSATAILNAGGGGRLTGTGTISATTIRLSSGTGDIGATGSPVSVRTTNLTASTGGSVNINSPAALTLAGASSAGGSSGFNLTAAGNLTLGRGATVTVTGDNLLSLSATGTTGSISQSATGVSLIGTNISIRSGAGVLASIGSVYVPIGVNSGVADAPAQLTVNAGGNIYVSGISSNSGSGAISISGASVAGGQIKLTAAGPIALGASTVSARGLITLIATGTGSSITQSGVFPGPASLLSPSITLNAGADIGTDSDNPIVVANIAGNNNPANLTITAGGNVFAAAGNSVSLVGISSAGGTSGFQLASTAGISLSYGALITGNSAIALAAGAGASITQAGPSTTLMSPSITLVADSTGSTGSIGSATAPIRTANLTTARSPVSLRLVAGRNICASNTGALLLGPTSAGAQLVLSSSGNIVFGSDTVPVTAGGSAVITSIGGITQSPGVGMALASPSITLNAGAGGVGAGTVPFAINGTGSSTDLTVASRGAVVLSSATAITLRSASAYGGFSLSTSGQASNIQTTGNVINNTSGGVLLGAGGALTVGSTTSLISYGPLQLMTNNGGALRVAGLASVYSGPVQLYASGGAITTSGTINAYSGGLTMTADAEAINIAGGAVNSYGTGASGNLQLIAVGNITVAGTLTAGNVLSIQTTGSSNGSIALNSNVVGNRGVMIATTGSGTLSTAARTIVSAPYGPVSITTSGITLAGSVSAGANTVAIDTTDPAQPISLGATAPGALSLPGATLRQITAGTISIGSFSQTGGITVGSALSLPNSNLVLSTKGNYSAASQAITLAYGRSISVSVKGTCDTGSVNGNTYSGVTFNAGTDLTVSGQITAPYGAVRLASTGSGAVNVNANVGSATTTSIDITDYSGNILFGAGVQVSTSGTVTVAASGAGSNIRQLGQGTTIAGTSVVLRADTTSGGGGAIGTDSQSIGVAHIYGGRYPVAVTAAASGGIYVNSSGYMTVGDVSTNMSASSSAGSIVLTSSTGLLKVNSGAHITASGGSITVQSNDTTGKGAIEIGASAVLRASSTVDGVGQVNVVIGQVPVSPQTTSAPAYVSLNQTDGGQVLFGSKGITTLGPVNVLNASGRNIVFSTGNQPKSLITLDGKVNITADPPATPASGTDSDLTPIAYTEATAPVNRAIEKMFTAYRTGLIDVRHKYALYAPRKDIDIDVIGGRLKVGAGAVVLVVSASDSAAVYDLHDRHVNDVALTVAGCSMILAPGRHMLLTSSNVESLDQANPIQSVGHRNIRAHDLGCGLKAFRSEFSIVSALNCLKPLLQMGRSKSPGEARIIRQLMKDAAIIQFTRGAAGSYRWAAAGGGDYVAAQR